MDDFNRLVEQQLGPPPPADTAAALDWNRIIAVRTLEATLSGGGSGPIYAVGIQSGAWALIGSDDYRPQVGERLDYSRFAPVGVGRDLGEALACWEANINAVD